MKTRLRLILPAVLLLAAVIAAILLLGRRGNGDGILAHGTVEATEADLGFMTAGRVAEVDVREGDRVDSGRILARLDQSELQARRRAAAAQAVAARAVLDELLAGSRTEEIAQARAALRAAERRLTNASEDLERAKTLFAGGAVSRQQLDAQETAYEVARSDAERAKEQVELVTSGPRAERIAAQRASVAQADAAVHQVDALLDYSVVRAPFAGIITQRDREPGEAVSAGVPVVTLLNPADRWVRIYLSEAVVGRIHIGDSATITTDASDRSYDGQVSFIASEAEFTPRNVQTTEERVKLVYQVRVRIVGDQALDLKSGVPADVHLEPGAP